MTPHLEQKYKISMCSDDLNLFTIPEIGIIVSSDIWQMSCRFKYIFLAVFFMNENLNVSFGKQHATPSEQAIWKCSFYNQSQCQDFAKSVYPIVCKSDAPFVTFPEFRRRRRW